MSVTRRRAPVRVVLSALVAGAVVAGGVGQAAAAGGGAAQSWAAPQIAAVVTAGAMGPAVSSFRPSDPITRNDLYAALMVLGKPMSPPDDPQRSLTVRELDARIVAALGLLPVARSIRFAARDAGLEPTAMLGTETVARLLGLRYNHPLTEEALELGPKQLATRAEAAYSLARVQQLSPYDLERVTGYGTTFAFPELDQWQRALVSRALGLVGSPYVWAGASELRQQRWSATTGGLEDVPGGFDCSGLVWRVFKLEPLAGAPGLAGTLQGRTSYAMSGEVARADRIGIGALRPADVVFFGERGPKSKPAEIYHMGIYVGNGWFVHSSTGGVTLQPLEGWYASRFAWARRPLAEAGV